METKSKGAAPDSKKPGRVWRFYGTFACLALLNLICAIDATILAVALPVREFHRVFENTLTDSSEDYCHSFKCYSYSSLLVWHIVPVVLHSIPYKTYFFVISPELLTSLVVRMFHAPSWLPTLSSLRTRC